MRKFGLVFALFASLAWTNVAWAVATTEVTASNNLSETASATIKIEQVSKVGKKKTTRIHLSKSRPSQRKTVTIDDRKDSEVRIVVIWQRAGETTEETRIVPAADFANRTLDLGHGLTLRTASGPGEPAGGPPDGTGFLPPFGPTSPPNASSIQVSIGGSLTHIPVVSGGTRVLGPGFETSIVDGSHRIPGVSAGVDVVVPVDRIFFAFDHFRASLGFNGFDDSVSGTAPIGTSSAFTYIFPNPVSGSTGIGPTVTGQTVTLDTRGTIWDFAFGPAARIPTGRNVSEGSRSFWTYGIGVRYRNSNVTHHIRQESLTFVDLNSTIDLDIRSHFIAPDFALGFEVAPSAPSGAFAGISAFVAPGVLITDASASQISRCGPCGAASPEFALVLDRNFDNSTFAIMTGVKGFVGYQINPAIRLLVDASYQYLSHVSTLAVPTSPLRQPITLVNSYSDMFSARGSLVVAFKP